ncbi:MAG: response regulator transcription factor [Actinomycetota bacterium]|nr:response regulator transcription factor [Actinomycetota bacterium]
MVPHPREELFSVLVVDAHPLLREAVASRLASMGAGPVYEASSMAEARARATASGPCDLAVLDLNLPDDGGLELVRELRNQGWPRIIVLASSKDSHAVRSAFQSGAQACLLKPASTDLAADGVRETPGTRVGTVPSRAPAVAETPRLTKADNHPRELSAREIEVLQLVADGQSNKEIGNKLNLSALTVKSHLSRIGRKIATGDRAQMVALAMRAGVIH